MIILEKSSLTEASAPDIDPSSSHAERLFSGPIGAEYHMLDLICPAAAAMSARVGNFVAALPSDAAKCPAPLSAFEIG
jgi:tRNA (cmo5U34)-methyltransferase